MNLDAAMESYEFEVKRPIRVVLAGIEKKGK